MRTTMSKSISTSNPWAVGIVLALLSAGLGFVTVRLGMMAGVMLVALSIALPVVYASVVYPKFGIVVLIILQSFIFLFIRMGSSFPLGTLVDGFQALLIIGFLIRQKFYPNWKIYHNPISIIVTVWIAYNFLQFFNPFAASILAWVYTIRSVALGLLMYYVFVYNLTSKEYIRTVIKVWLGISLFVALYACKQEFIGFYDFEEAGLQSEKMRSLLFIDGHWRKFSIYSDPVVYSYNMVVSALICFGLLWQPMAVYKKVILSLMCLFFLIVMLFSGTRGAYVLFPAALALFAVLNFNKKVLIFSVIAGFFMVCLIFMSTSNPYLVRFQTAFRPSEDASYKVRKMNQKRIQPYILSHPIGGGLGSVGTWGIRFAPNSELAKFPPDSGYARVAVELGYVGLFLLCLFMFIILKAGIVHFFKIRDPKLRNYCMTMTLVIFALNIGNFPQEAITQFPTNVFFCMAIAIVNATWLIYKKEQTI